MADDVLLAVDLVGAILVEHLRFELTAEWSNLQPVSGVPQQEP
jgi:hypothetical protein